MNPNDQKVSQRIEDFLTFIRSTEQILSTAQADEQQANMETQDILHALELDHHTYHQTAHLAKKLTDVRQYRRKAKDTEEIYSPVVEWMNSHRPVIKSIERMLGDVRKVEKRQPGKFYTPRTNILKEADVS